MGVLFVLFGVFCLFVVVVCFIMRTEMKLEQKLLLEKWACCFYELDHVPSCTLDSLLEDCGGFRNFGPEKLLSAQSLLTFPAGA